MPAPKGHPKWGGKKKGSKHLTLAKDVRTKLEEMGCDPISGLAAIAMDENSDPALKAHCFGKLPVRLP